ncbi:reverse transcriptase [Colletotrichum graminicola M1.001]|uniref:Reverse transcriptase n=1 Tax=Colletotrichum graminicola (strain M1.001 / M2 / FGSC 10212) TaxID=645133 RepID=E3Q3Q9_COLGM|nr:reverse transcriptase [Colletotrichum graminicola M1.001]EFQ25661.1 reverse transcriptase [Colletotrichum graminicola M1.001]
MAAKAFRKEVRLAKARYWTDQIDKMDTDKEMYRVMGWHKPSSQLRAPPLQDGENIVTAPIEKANVLRKRLLERFNADTDIDLYTLVVPRRRIKRSDSIPLEEVESVLLGAGNTTLGVDGITMTLLWAAWLQIQGDAETVMILKPNKDISLPGGWRPISLLLTIGKGLERLVARRMAQKIVKYNILHPQVAGALPGRSATDIVAALTHDVKTALD